MKALQIYYKIPFPTDDGGAVSILSASHSLESVGIDLHILALNQLNSTSKTSEIPAGFKKRTKLQWVNINNKVSISGAIKSFITRRSYFSVRFFSRQVEKNLESVLRENQFDVIQLEHLYLWHYIRIIRKHSKAKIILRSQNVEHLLWLSVAACERRRLVRMWLLHEATKLKKIESSVHLLVDGIAAISDEDAIFFRKRNSSVPVRSISIAFESENADSAKISSKKPKVRFYHLGSMDWRPNLVGLAWVFDEVVPLVDCNGEFHFAGKKMPENLLEKNDGDRFFVSGRVDDADAFITDKDVLLVPLHSGGGVRVKILEALLNDKVVISTLSGCKGLPKGLINFINVANTPLEFANKIIEVSQNLADLKIRAQSAKIYIEKHLTHKKVGQQYLALYREVTCSQMQEES